MSNQKKNNQDIKVLHDNNLILEDYLKECSEEDKKNKKTDKAILNG